MAINPLHAHLIEIRTQALLEDISDGSFLLAFTRIAQLNFIPRLTESQILTGAWFFQQMSIEINNGPEALMSLIKREINDAENGLDSKLRRLGNSFMIFRNRIQDAQRLIGLST